MVDLLGRRVPRFPAEAEVDVAAAIAKAVGGSSSSVGHASAARGGDILFHEAARRFGIATTIVLPFDIESFIASSVAGVASGNWVARFWKLWEATPLEQRIMLDLPVNDQAFATCNAKILELAAAHKSYRLIALWDGNPDGGIGGTSDMIRTAKAQNAEVEVIAMETYRSMAP